MSETDSLKRLVCYDRETARLSGSAGSDDVKCTMAGPASAAGQTHAASDGATSGAANTDSKPKAAQTETNTNTANTAGADAAPRHIKARVNSVNNSPDDLVVHLDNGQVWEQVQSAPADLNLHPGDAITIDRQLGDYWLSGRNGAAVKVKQKQ
jgi:hypothetical protein